MRKRATVSFRFDRSTAAVLGLLAAGFALGCVGSEKGEGQDTQVILPDSVPPVLVYRDTVSPADYKIFNSVEASRRPKKVLYRLLVMQRATSEVLSKTLRVALDSIARTDSSLAAARAILYTFRRTGPTGGKLVPRVWGEWVPREGWDRAPPRSRKRVYRSYIYLGRPGWSVAEPGTVAEAGSRRHTRGARGR
jgi:hypothetical protein